VPSGHSVTIDSAQQSLKLEKFSTLFEDELGGPDDKPYEDIIRRSLADTFEKLKPALEGRPLFVTMSGGLDSSTIAALAKEYFGDFVGITFFVDDGMDRAEREDDLFYARKVASDLDVRLEEISATYDDLIGMIDAALIWGQDWRDFNVHCALVNNAIGKALNERFTDEERHNAVILTGDTMNELVADYSPVKYKGQDYYSLPRLPIDKVRQALVSGLDSGDREVGIFAHYGMDTIQPYAICANAYTILPSSYLSSATAKQDLVHSVMGEKIPSYVFERPKVRAQVGSSEEVGGTLAALVDQGFDQEKLAHRFAELHDIDPGELKNLIRAGYYRFTFSYPQ
jgi:asparagine synthetase B (glutamine-hydrolysing)